MVQLSSFLSASVQGGRVQLDDAAQTAQGRGVFRRLKDRIVMGSDQIKESNLKANMVFAQALAGEYGHKGRGGRGRPGDRQGLHRHAGQGQDRQMVSVAHGLSGMGKARDQARNVCLNSWPMVTSGLSVVRSGHSAVAIANTLSPNAWSHGKAYVSWWPAKSDVQVAHNRLLESLPGVGGHFAPGRA